MNSNNDEEIENERRQWEQRQQKIIDEEMKYAKATLRRPEKGEEKSRRDKERRANIKDDDRE